MFKQQIRYKQAVGRQKKKFAEYLKQHQEKYEIVEVRRLYPLSWISKLKPSDSEADIVIAFGIFVADYLTARTNYERNLVLAMQQLDCYFDLEDESEKINSREIQDARIEESAKYYAEAEYLKTGFTGFITLLRANKLLVGTEENNYITYVSCDGILAAVQTNSLETEFVRIQSIDNHVSIKSRISGS